MQCAFDLQRSFNENQCLKPSVKANCFSWDHLMLFPRRILANRTGWSLKRSMFTSGLMTADVGCCWFNDQLKFESVSDLLLICTEIYDCKLLKVAVPPRIYPTLDFTGGRLNSNETKVWINIEFYSFTFLFFSCSKIWISIQWQRMTRRHLLSTRRNNELIAAKLSSNCLEYDGIIRRSQLSHAAVPFPAPKWSARSHILACESCKNGGHLKTFSVERKLLLAKMKARACQDRSDGCLKITQMNPCASEGTGIIW